MLKEQKFGVELEFTGLTRKEAARVLGHLFGVNPVYEGGAYRTWLVLDHKNRYWKIKYDSSIRPEMPARALSLDSTDYRCELVTPVLEYEDIPLLQEVIRTLRRAGARVNDSCGLHVHVDASNHTAKSLRNLAVMWSCYQDLTYKALRVKEQRLEYCKKLGDDLFERMLAARKPSMEELANLWYGTLAPHDNPRAHYNASRYHGLNLHNVWYRGTVEWRCFNATLHAGEVKAYVQFCLAMSAQAIRSNGAFKGRKVDPDAGYPYRTMCTWLIRMGLAGEEFKTCRLHLTKNLRIGRQRAAS